MPKEGADFVRGRKVQDVADRRDGVTRAADGLGDLIGKQHAEIARLRESCRKWLDLPFMKRGDNGCLVPYREFMAARQEACDAWAGRPRLKGPNDDRT